MPSAAQIDEIIQRIESGESYSDIARSLSVNVSTVWRWCEADDETAQRSARAREKSAESWLDRGLAVIESSLSKSGDVDPSAARAFAQECARRAAIRNPQYRDKQDVALSGAVTLTLGKEDASVL